MIKITCIKNCKIFGDVYGSIDVIWECYETECYLAELVENKYKIYLNSRYIGDVDTKYFISFAEWRELRIASIID